MMKRKTIGFERWEHWRFEDNCYEIILPGKRVTVHDFHCVPVSAEIWLSSSLSTRARRTGALLAPLNWSTEPGHKRTPADGGPVTFKGSSETPFLYGKNARPVKRELEEGEFCTVISAWQHSVPGLLFPHRCPSASHLMWIAGFLGSCLFISTVCSSSGLPSSITDVQSGRKEREDKGWESLSSNVPTGPSGYCLFP